MINPNSNPIPLTSGEKADFGIELNSIGQQEWEEDAVALPASRWVDRTESTARRNGRISDAYLKFLVKELKPFNDQNYRTLPDQAHTLMMGSSMGGLISLYALEQFPHIFGAADCLSTHWPIGDDILVEYLGGHLPAPGSHRLYFDYGTATLDAEYEPYQNRLDAWMQRAGFQLGKDWITQKFEGAEHNEAAWRARVHIPLKFLLS